MNPRIASVAFLAAVFTLNSAFGKPAVKVTFSSACAAKNQHGVDRWRPKTDASPIPSNKAAIQKVTPSDILAWKGPGPKVPLTRKTETRLPSEQRWYQLTGRVVDVRVEADGDIHVALQDTRGTARVGVEVPVGKRWCKIRQVVFGWTNAKFPFSIKSNKVFTITKPHVIAVTGKAFYDVDHAPKDHSNRSTIHENTARVGNSPGFGSTDYSVIPHPAIISALMPPEYPSDSGTETTQPVAPIPDLERWRAEEELRLKRDELVRKPAKVSRLHVWCVVAINTRRGLV